MKLEVGMYVRTDEGKITKIIEIDKDGFERVDKCIDFTNYNIIKASHNIIDLIEVGDYVNGHLVLDVFWNVEEDYVVQIEDAMYDLTRILYSNDIKSIVTKEQFESMSYKVEVK